ncbi:hypothetical protein [Agromyces sp. GXQ0307]
MTRRELRRRRRDLRARFVRVIAGSATITWFIVTDFVPELLSWFGT